MNYNKNISIGLLKELLNYDFPAYKYLTNGYDGSPVYYTKDKNDPEWSNCDAYRIPTYADVIDWFMSKGIVITLRPFFTFSLKDRIGFNWEISCIDNDNCKMKTIEELDMLKSEQGYGGSFQRTMEEAIVFALYNVLNNE